MTNLPPFIQQTSFVGNNPPGRHSNEVRMHAFEALAKIELKSNFHQQYRWSHQTKHDFVKGEHHYTAPH